MKARTSSQSTATVVSSSKSEDQHDDMDGISHVLKYVILALICLMAFAIRLFAVVRWESVIHEYDPHFNYRTTKFLATEGPYKFLNWFDDRSWYPLGRIVGGTIYPGLMATAAYMHWFLNWLNISMNIRNMCVMTAPIFSANTAIATYLFVHEASRRASTSLLAAALVAIVPAYISRSVGGSYDNEGVAIFALIFTFWLWIKSVNTGSMLWALGCALAYFYMVAAWGGYVFIINIIPIYVMIMIVCGRWSSRLYVAYCTFYVVGTILAMQVPFVGFNVFWQAECAASHGVFVFCNGFVLLNFIREKMSSQGFETLLRTVFTIVIGVVALGILALQLSGKMEWTGRSLTLLDPTYASKYIPIIASVSEHQPTSWTSFFFDLHIATPFAPVGLFFLFDELTDGKIFVILYGTIAWYFAGIMVRLMLTLAPIACILAAFGISALLRTMSAAIKAAALEPDTHSPIDPNEPEKSARKRREEANAKPGLPASISSLVMVGVYGLLVFYSMHAVFVSSEAYSSPSVVLGSKLADGSKRIFDDFREAYFWLRHNTPEDARIMSWWDYGYQLSSMSNRTVLVDNNTWNNTHIATVGRAMASNEANAYPILQSLDVDYVLVVFGAVARYSSDDINKFLWMVRIAQGVYPDEVAENNFYSSAGRYDMGPDGNPKMHESLMFKMSYYRFTEMMTEYDKPSGYDGVRQTEVGGPKKIHLEHLEEAYTTEHWIVRIYKVKKEVNVNPSGVVKTPKASKPDKVESQKKVEDKDVQTKYIGCYTSEKFFTDKVYKGGATGANFNLARHAAASAGKRYFAVARAVTDGHSFIFNKLEDKPNKASSSRGCDRPCADSSNVCGCVDDLCNDPTPADEEHNRRWAVYEIVSEEAAARSSSKGRKRN